MAKKKFKQLALPGMPRPRDLMTPEARYPRGYTPERQREIRALFDRDAWEKDTPNIEIDRTVHKDNTKRPIDVFHLTDSSMRSSEKADKVFAQYMKGLITEDEKDRELWEINNKVENLGFNLMANPPASFDAEDDTDVEGTPYKAKKLRVNDPADKARVIDAVARTTIPTELLDTVKRFVIHNNPSVPGRTYGEIPNEPDSSGVHRGRQYRYQPHLLNLPELPDDSTFMSQIDLLPEALNRNDTTVPHEIAHSIFQNKMFYRRRDDLIKEIKNNNPLDKPQESFWDITIAQGLAGGRDFQEVAHGTDEGVADRFALDHRGKIFKHAAGKKLDLSAVDVPSGYPAKAFGAKREEELSPLNPVNIHKEPRFPFATHYDTLDHDWATGYLKGFNSNAVEQANIKKQIANRPKSRAVGPQTQHFANLYKGHQLEFTVGSGTPVNARGRAKTGGMINN